MVEDELRKLKNRRDDLRAELRKTNPEIFDEQKHTDSGTAEKAYWHFGYMMALDDVLRLLLPPPNA